MTLANYFELILPVAVFVVGVLAGWAKCRERYLTWSERRAAHRAARDHATTDAAHLSEPVEAWAARTRLQPTRIELPRKEGS